MISGKLTIRKKEVFGRLTEKAPALLQEYTGYQLLLKVRTEKRANDRRKGKY